MNLRDFGAVQLLSGWVGHSSKLRSRSARAAVLGLAGATAFAAQLGFAATTTINTLLDTDNNTATGCAVATLNGAVNGVESIVNTIVIADATGYRTQSITMQTCISGTSFTAPGLISNTPTPIAPGNGVGGTTAVESYVPHIFLPPTGQPIRVAVTTAGSDGLTGGDALTLTAAGGPILISGAALLVVPTLATFSLGLTALLLVGALWFARRRGWAGMQLVVVSVFALSLSGQLIAAIIRDGFVTDWTGVAPAATDPTGDAPTGSDITNFYSVSENSTVFFRYDMFLNAPPIANAQSVTAKVGETLPITLTGTDYESSPLTFTIVTPPTQGVLGGTAPNITYTPNPTATAADSIVFRVNDGTFDSANATVTITNTRAPAITSANNVIFIPTQANTFAFTSNGMPTPTAAFGGCTPALPSVTFTPDTNGGGTLSGSPLVSEAGPHTCTFTSINGVTPNATQSFTLTVGGAPTITSAAALSVPELAPFTHTVTTTSIGLPITGMAQPTGTLPSAVTFTYAGAPAATATVGGTPAVCTRGTHPITLTASNVVGTTTQNFTLTVRPVNQAPSFTAGATQTVNEDSGPQTVAGWATALNKGAPCESAQVLTFEVTGNTNPALFSALPAVNGTNGNLTFTPAANANGTATITLRVRDDGGVVDGGVDVSATQNLVINVTAVNDAPVLTAGATLAYTENGPAAVIDNTITIADIDSANLVGATVVISGNYQNGQDVLAFVNASGITGNFVAGTGTLTLTGSSSLANYQAALRSVTYVNTSDNPSALTRTVSWTVDDGTAPTNLSNTATSSITVTPVNDAPVVVAGNTLAYTENQAASALSPGLTVADVDSANLTAATVQITGNYVNGQDVLSFVNAGGITGSFAAATGTMTLTGSAPVATWQTALRSVSYANTSDNPSTLARTVTWIANDGAAPSAAVTSTIAITAVNDAPVLTAGATLAFTEGSPAAVIDGTITVSDVDSLNLTGATVQITTNYVNGEDILGFANTVNISGVFTAATGTLTLTGPDTLANYQTALRSVTYNNASITPSTLARTVTWIGNDGAAPSAAVTSTINVTAVNSPPAINSAAPTTATEDTLYTYSATRIDADGPGQTWSTIAGNTCAGTIVAGTGVYTFTPVGPVPAASCVVAIQVCDGGTPNLCATQTTTVTITAVNDAPVINSTPPTPATEDALYTYNATRTDLDGPGQTWSLLGTNTCAGASIVAGTGVYTFTPVGPTPPANCVIAIQVCDGGAPDLCGTQTTTLTITPVNSAPVISSVAPTTATEDVLYSYNATRTDLDGPGQTWSLLPANTCGGAIVAGTGVYTFTPVGPVPAASCVVAIQVCDGGTPNLCATQTTTVTITAVNDAPVINSTPPTPATEDVAYTYNATRTDLDGPGQTWSLLGTNTCAGAAIVAGTGVYTFTPAGPTPPATCDISIQVCDTGAPNLCGTQTFTLTITPVNSAPVINSVAPTTATEDVLYTYNATRTDLDGPGQTWTLLPAHTCGGAIVAGTGVFTFTPAGPVPAASCVVAVQVCDGGAPNLCATQTTTVTITAVNDAPVINSTAPTPATEDVLYTYNATMTDPDGPGQTWSTIAGNTCAGTIVPGTGVYTFTPLGPVPPASCAVAIQVCDGGTPNLCATQTTIISITAVNDAPVISSVAPATATEDVLYTYNATMTDLDGPGQTWSLLPAHTCGGSIVAGTGAFSFTPLGPIPAASCVVAIQVCDGGTPNLCVSQNTTVTIIAVNDAPIPTNPGTLAAHVHIPITFAAATLGGTDPDLGVVTIDLAPTSVLAGATVTINANGSFTFNPPAEATGTVVGFAYRVCDNGNPAPSVCSAYQNVSFNLTGPIIYHVKTAPAGNANCTLTHECTLAAALTNIGVLTNRTIFIADAGAYTQAVTLNSGGSLYGQGVTGANFDTVFGIIPPGAGTIPARPAIGSTRPSVTSGGTTVTLNTNNTLRGLNLTSPSGPTLNGINFGTLTASDISITGGLPALSLNNGTAAATFDVVSSTGGANNILLSLIGGTLGMNGGALSGGTVRAIDIDGGTATISYAGTIANTVSGLRVINKTGGTVTFGGAAKTLNTGANTAVTLTSNTGATINFTGGGLDIDTTSGAGFSATAGGTISVQGSGNSITSGTGTALNVANTTIGASGLNFQSISANGAVNGILLNTTGAGGLTVTGTGATAGSGGTIQNISGRGVSAISAQNVSLSNMNFTNTATSAGAPCGSAAVAGANTGCNAAVHLDTVTNVTLDRVNMTTSAQQGVNGINVTNFSLTNSALSGLGNGPDEDGLHFHNMLGTNVITNTTIASSGDDNVNVQNLSSTASTLTVTGGSFNTGVQGSGLLFGSRNTANLTVNVTGATINNNFSGGLVADGFDTATLVLRATNNTITNNNDGVQVSANNGSSSFDINTNTFTGNDFVAITLLKAAFSTGGTLQGAVRNNNITIANNVTADGIFGFQAGAGALTAAVTNNIIDYAGTQRAIAFQGGQEIGVGSALNATITGNTIDVKLDGTNDAAAGMVVQGTLVDNGTAANSPTTAICADIGGAGALRNTFTHSLGGAPIIGGDIRVRQRFWSTWRLPGYGGAAADTAAVVSYLAGRNTVVTAPTASVFSTGFAGGAACTAPVIP